MTQMHELPWLLTAPDDFNKRCAELEGKIDFVSAVLELSSAALTLNQSNRLIRLVDKVEGAKAELSQALPCFKLGLISNATTELLVPSLIATSLRHGIYLEVISSDFGQITQEAFDKNSQLNQSNLDAVLVALDYRAYPFATHSLTNAAEGLAAEDGMAYLSQVREAFKANSGTLCILQTLATPPFALAGSLDAQLEGMLRNEIADFNTQLACSVKESSDALLDIAALANAVGAYNWFDERQWYMSRIPMANIFIPLYCDHVARVIAALRGKSKKCLVLDLDNTLWNGVIGDDGLDGIFVGQGSPLGESHLAIQQYALELKKFGIILAVCSKNEMDIALQPFREHPDMLLREDDFSVFVANWEDKGTNIRSIAEILDIGLDSIVFLDDNPFERDVVRKLAPEVSVPELPNDPALIPRTLAAAGYFEKIDLTREDIEKSAQYAANAQRNKALQEYGNINDFLESLDMSIQFSPFDAIGRKRITQLINKTNQFNLTTKRYTEARVQEFETSPNTFTRQVRLTDKFGDSGMISVLICREESGCWEIDTWLMSCRAIKRRVEEAICDNLFQAAKKRNIKVIRGYYRPTEKNMLVKDHYQSLGFKQTETTFEQEVWEMSVDQYAAKNPPIKVLH